MSNVKQEISSHNKAVTRRSQPVENVRECDCSVKKDCPLGGKCLTENVIYQAKVTRSDNKKEETYFGLTSTEFKVRYRNHMSSFEVKDKKEKPSQKSPTTLCHYVRKLKKENIEFKIQWKIVDRGKPYCPEAKKCNLCIKEKYFIICRPDMATLNSRKELYGECRHRKKPLLCRVT